MSVFKGAKSMTFVNTTTATGSFSTEDMLEKVALLAKNITGSKVKFNADGSASVTLTVNGQAMKVVFTGFDGIDSLDAEFSSIEFRNSGGNLAFSLSASDLTLRDLASATNSEKVAELLFSENDTIYGDKADDSIVGYEGDDYLAGYAGDDFLDGWYDDDELSGGSGKDVLYGGAGNDNVYGDSGNDFVSGGVGNDWVSGGTGKDVVQGNKGADTLFGGSGADMFVFKTLSESTIKANGRDTIMDFRPDSGDRIDLSLIDANRKVDGNQAFKFVGDSEFHKKAGELRFTQTDTQTFIYADANGDGKADFSITLDAAINLVKGDFIL